jgi:hypothetical protein
VSDIDVYTNKDPDPKIVIAMEYNTVQIFHLWMSIANYQAYRAADPDPEIEPMETNHPLIRIQHTIQGMLDQLIAQGMQGGFYIAPLVEIKKILTEASESNGDG